jgi:hypothetical protein
MLVMSPFLLDGNRLAYLTSFIVYSGSPGMGIYVAWLLLEISGLFY